MPSAFSFSFWLLGRDVLLVFGLSWLCLSPTSSGKVYIQLLTIYYTLGPAMVIVVDVDGNVPLLLECCGMLIRASDSKELKKKIRELRELYLDYCKVFY